MPQVEEIRNGPHPAAAPWVEAWQQSAQGVPPGYPPAWYYPPPAFQYAPPPAEEPPAPDSPLQKLAYSVDEAAQVLGVSRSTVYTLIHRADFPALKIGNRQLISREGLAEWVRKQAGGGRGPGQL